MTDRPILIDSSAWIEFFREGRADVADRVERAIQSGQAATCDLVRLELLVGARTESSYQEIAMLLDTLVQIPITKRCWDTAAWMGFTLRRRGLALRNTDLIIAAAARDAGAEVLHCNSHFDVIAGLDEHGE